MKFIIIFISLFSKVYAADFYTRLSAELDSIMSRNDMKQVAQADSELNLRLETTLLNPFYFGVDVVFTSELAKDNGPVSRLNSLGPVASYSNSFFEDDLSIDFSYRYLFIQDSYLRNNYSLTGNHSTELAIGYKITHRFSTELYGEYVEYTGGIPRFRETPDYDYTYGIDFNFSFSKLSIGQSFERNVSAHFNELHKRSNKVYDMWHFISYIETEVYGFDIQLSGILYPIRKNYVKTFSKDTFKDFDIGLNISKTLEF